MLFSYVVYCLIKIKKEIKKYAKHKNNRLLLKFIIANDFALREYLGKRKKVFFFKYFVSIRFTNNLTFNIFLKIT